MRLREAARKVRSVKSSGKQKVAVLSSFEPLHLKTFILAYLADRFPEDTPAVVEFGYDQLEEGLTRTSGQIKNAPALLCLSWEDLHPGLSWRTRSQFSSLNREELSAEGLRLASRLLEWLRARGLAESYIALPPTEWLPLVDSCPSGGVGATAAAAISELWIVASGLASEGARLLDVHGSGLNYRELLQAGSPLPLEMADELGRLFVDMAFRRTDRRKALIVDLDDTIWSGVIGEDGPERVLSGPSGKGHAFHVFQKFLLKLKADGTLLAFCSKNNSEDVLGCFDTLGMPLKLSDFSAYRCNWDSKPQNIWDIAADLNIGVESLVFVDDNPAELLEVREAFPEIMTVRTPQEGNDWCFLFRRLQDLFGTWDVRDEDRIRSRSTLHRDSVIRVKGAFSPQEGSKARLRNFGLEILIRADAMDDPRSLELINKTNQFNLTGERVSTEEWLDWGESEGAFCMSARLKDRYGDFGTICVVTGNLEDGESVVCLRHFVLSCRAFGREVEMVVLGELARLGRPVLKGIFRETGKNEPARRFLEGLGLDVSSGGEWQLAAETVETSYRRSMEETGMKVIVEASRGVTDAP